MKKFKTHITCLFICTFFIDANAQDYTALVRPQKVSRWSIGIMASPDFGSRFFKGEKKTSEDGLGVSDNTAQNKELAKMFHHNEYPGFQYTTGIHFLYDINKRWFARLGIYYSEKTIRANGFVTYIKDTPGFFYVDGVKSKSPFPFLEIPLTFHYILNKPFDKSKKGTCYTTYLDYNRKKPLFYIFAGPAYAVNIDKHYFESRRGTPFGDTLFTDSRPVYVDPFSINHFGFYIGAGVMKYFNKHLFVTAEPVFRFLPARWYSKKFNDKPEINDNNWARKASVFHVVDKPWSVGLQVALNYHF